MIPNSLKWLSDLVGEDLVNDLLIHFSGQRFYVPAAKHLTHDHKLVPALGFDRAYQIAQAVQVSEESGDRLVLAFRYTPELREKRAEVIKKMADSSLFTNSDIGLIFNLGSRQIANIKKTNTKSNYNLKPNKRTTDNCNQLILFC